MKHRLLLFSIYIFLSCFQAFPQFKRATDINTTPSSLSQNPSRNNINDDENEGRNNRTTWGRDSTKHAKKKNIPTGQFQWILDPRLGTIIDAENNDTTVHNYQNWNNTEGYTGQYSILGNIGAPRYNRIFMNDNHEDEDYIFLRPLSYFRGGLKDFRFTNTKSPITNLAYHSCGTRQNGEDRVRAYFATNINKLSGLGFKIDYVYGRGYYNYSANSMFGTTFYGYYRGDKYNVHAYANVNHMKMAENGGIEDDEYIENPQSFPQSYSSTDIPVLLTETWNRNHERNFYLTHRYNFGFYREIEIPDSLKPKVPSVGELTSELPDSIQQLIRTDSIVRKAVVDSLVLNWKAQQVAPKEFIPVSSVLHTMDFSDLTHTYIAKSSSKEYYTHQYFGDPGKVEDMTGAFTLRNTFGLALREGFNKWAQMGLTAFVSHKLRSYNLLKGDTINNAKYTENDLSVGAELARTQGKLLHFNINSEFWLAGPRVGDLSIDGKTSWEFPLGKKDSLLIDVKALIKNEKPNFFYRHYRSQNSWWDNDELSKQFRTRFEGVLRLKKTGTRLRIGFENITNYTYFAMQKTLNSQKTESFTPTDYSYAVNVHQNNGSVQVFMAALSQDFKVGPLHWDNEVTYQSTSNDDVLPLPKLSLYTNLYLLFKVAKVMRVQIGGDMRFFTKYYGLDYTPSIQSFAVQDPTQERTYVGNYPFVNVYANMHLKHCRLYFAVNHVNAGTGHYFYVPHYPVNPLNIHFGLSWNFFN